jgi:hypothetical protein
MMNKHEEEEMNSAWEKKMAAAEQKNKVSIFAEERLALQDNPQSVVGTAGVAKLFGDEWHFGTVVSFDKDTFFWGVEYEDEDTEEYDIDDLVQRIRICKNLVYEKKKYNASSKKQAS